MYETLYYPISIDIALILSFVAYIIYYLLSIYIPPPEGFLPLLIHHRYGARKAKKRINLSFAFLYPTSYRMEPSLSIGIAEKYLYFSFLRELLRLLRKNYCLLV
jgi:hypothetical protein